MIRTAEAAVFFPPPSVTLCLVIFMAEIKFSANITAVTEMFNQRLYAVYTGCQG